MGFHCLRTAEFHRPVHIKPQMEVVAIGRVFQSRKLMATSGVVTDKESKLDCKELMIATCKITKVVLISYVLETKSCMKMCSLVHYWH